MLLILGRQAAVPGRASASALQVAERASTAHIVLPLGCSPPRAHGLAVVL